MKKLVFFILVMLLGFNITKAQDMLITTKLDTLNCKLGALNKDNQYPIKFVMDDEMMEGLIHKDSILVIRKNVFRGLRNDKLRPWYSLMDIGLDAGAAHQFGSFRIDDDLTDKGDFAARTGFYIGADMAFFVGEMIGYGLKYNYRSLLGGDICYQYIGPMMAFRIWDKNKKNHLFFTFSGGYGWMVQKNAPIQFDLIRPRIEMHAKAFTGDIALGYNYRLSKHVSAHVKISCNIGYPNFVRIQDISKYVRPNEPPLEIGNYCHSMNTFNLSAGFTFHK